MHAPSFSFPVVLFLLGQSQSLMQQGPTQIPHLTLNLFLLCSFLKMLLPPSRPLWGLLNAFCCCQSMAPGSVSCLQTYLCLVLSSALIQNLPAPHWSIPSSTCSQRQQKEDSGFEPQPSPSHRGNMGRDLVVLLI